MSFFLETPDETTVLNENGVNYDRVSALSKASMHLGFALTEKGESAPIIYREFEDGTSETEPMLLGMKCGRFRLPFTVCFTRFSSCLNRERLL